MANKRAAKRRHLTYYLSIRTSRTQEELGRLADLSTLGMLLLTSTPPSVGEVLDLEIVPPETSGRSRKALPCTAEVRWVRPDVNPSSQAVGLRFVHAPDEGPTLLLIRALGFED